MTATDRVVFGLNEVEAAAVNAIRSDYYDGPGLGTHWETVDRIMAVTGLRRPESDWLLMLVEPVVAGPLPEEAFR